MEPYFSDRFYNASALYLASRSISKDVEKARASIAAHLGARSAEIIFTAGGTEADNLAIQGVMSAHPGANLVVSAIEHHAVLRPAEHYQYRVAGVRPDGRLDLPSLEKLIDDQTVLVSVMYANNEIGTIQPIREISEFITRLRLSRQQRNIKLPLYLHTDACQAANYLDLHVSRLGVDLMTLNAGKIYGPKQCGALYVKAGTVLQPLILGGGQEHGLRSGTENVANIVGFAAALDLVQTDRQAEAARLTILRQHFAISLLAKLPSTVVNGSLKQRLPNNLHLTFLGQDNERLLMQLDERGILCAAGSACAASSEEPSHVLKAIGLSDREAQASLRFTIGRQTTLQDIDSTVMALVDILGRP